jgi:hypothetical protein
MMIGTLGRGGADERIRSWTVMDSRSHVFDMNRRDRVEQGVWETARTIIKAMVTANSVQPFFSPSIVAASLQPWRSEAIVSMLHTFVGAVRC